MKERKKPEKCLLPHGRPSDDRSCAFSSRAPSKAAKIKALISYGIISQGSRESARFGRGSIRILGVSPVTQRAGGGQCLCTGEHGVPPFRGRLDQRRTVAAQRGRVMRD